METRAEFLKKSKSERDKLKDVGGYIGGEMQGNIRKSGYVKGRDLVTLDMDSIPAGQTDSVLNRLDALNVNYCVYSTRNHSPESPRLRAVFPLDRTVSADEYEPIARKMAQILQPEMTWFDPTTFEVSRIMYWPSVSYDSVYVYNWADRSFTSADGLLGLYPDWRDFNAWPTCPTEKDIHKSAEKQADPLTKSGCIGAFCKVYTIQAAIAKYLPDIYIPAGDGRYTYAKGSTTGGAVVYDGKFLYSHHATDPASNTLCNAFDLVRIHFFGAEDDTAKPDTPVNRLPSYLKMKELALADSDVDMQIRQDRAAGIYDEFADIISGTAEDPSASKENTAKLSSWLKLLKIDGNGNYVKSYENVLIALENDPLLKGRIYMNTFTQRPIAVAPLPWGAHKTAAVNTQFDWTDADDAGLLTYLEKLMHAKLSSTMQIALAEYLSSHTFHPVQAYLSGLVWDGIPRIETVFQIYLGAEDTEYVRAVAKMTFVAAVTRIYQPGTKFDTVVVFVGSQGFGKSRFISTLAKYYSWFTDSVKAFDKSAIENIQGIWLVELAELSALKHGDLETTKAFISRTVDRTRLAYGRRSVDLPRTCIFFGTTNNHDFLKDSTGDRRFLPIDIKAIPPQKNIYTDLPNEVDQLWAEAMFYYKEGKTPLILPENVRGYAKKMQDEHFDRSDIHGLIEAFLERKLPTNWDEFNLDQRILWYADKATQRTDLVPRNKVCAMEIWCECLNGKKDNFPKIKSWEINDILRSIPGWHQVTNPRNYDIYGRQRGFERNAP